MAWIVPKDLKSGRRYYIVDRIDGSPKQIGKTSSFAEARKIKANAESGKRKVASGDVTLVELFDRWLKDLAPPVKEPSTFRGYKAICRLMLDEFGRDKEAHTLTPKEITSYRDLVTKRASGHTSHKHVGQLRRIFKWGIEQELVSENPAMKVSLPTPEHKEQEIVSKEAFFRLLSGAKARERAIILLALGTGLRASEVVALQWRDIDMERGLLYVNRKVVEGHWGRPKTKNSRRVIPLHDLLIVMLGEHQQRMNEAVERRQANIEKWKKSKPTPYKPDGKNLIFVNQYFEPINWHNFWQRTIRGLYRDAGLEKGFRLHSLRHTFATILAESGADPKLIQSLLGHSSVRVTYDLYVHRMSGKHVSKERPTLDVLSPMLAKAAPTRQS